EIVLVASTGLHANGASLARLLAGRAPDGYATALPSGRRLGEALLDPAPVYAGLIAAVLGAGVELTYISHITGHGLLKLMRPPRPFTYMIERLPPVPEVLGWIVEEAQLTPAAAYSTFNMGAGLALYCARGTGDRAVAVAAELG